MSMDGQPIPNTQLQLAQVGDALLKLIYITNFFPNTTSEQQRQFSVLASNVHLAKLACILGLQELSPHLTESSNVRARATVLEAIIGAVFLDSGMDIPTAGHAIGTMRVFQHFPDERSKERQHAIVLPSPKGRRARMVAKRLDSVLCRCTSSGASGAIDEARAGPGKRSSLPSEDAISGSTDLSVLTGSTGERSNPAKRKLSTVSPKSTTTSAVRSSSKYESIVTRYREVLALAKRDPKRVLEATTRKKTSPAMLRSHLSQAIKRREAQETKGQAGSLVHQYYSVRSAIFQHLLDFRLAAGPEWRNIEQSGQKPSRNSIEASGIEVKESLSARATSAQPNFEVSGSELTVSEHDLEKYSQFHALAISDPKSALTSLKQRTPSKLRRDISHALRWQEGLEKEGMAGANAHKLHVLRAQIFQCLLDYRLGIVQQSDCDSEGDPNVDSPRADLFPHASCEQHVSHDPRRIYAQFHV